MHEREIDGAVVALAEPACGCVSLTNVAGASAGMVRLTVREREVAALLGAGLPNRLIARRLDISERTAKAHVKSIVTKLGVRTRLEAALMAILHHRLICQQQREISLESAEKQLTHAWQKAS